MDLAEIRRLIIIALFSDDELIENSFSRAETPSASSTGSGAGAPWTSISPSPDDFADVQDVRERIRRGLEDRFDIEEAPSVSNHPVLFIPQPTPAPGKSISHPR